MPFLNHEIVGTIALSPAGVSPPADQQRRSDETTLGDLLAALAAYDNDEQQPRRLVASARISRFMAEELPTHSIVRADVSRLADQLAREYADVAGT